MVSRCLVSFFGRQELADPDDYVAAGNYIAMDSDQLTIHEGELLRLVEVGTDNWWRVRSALSAHEGWVPARYLTTAN